MTEGGTFARIDEQSRQGSEAFLAIAVGFAACFASLILVYVYCTYPMSKDMNLCKIDGGDDGRVPFVLCCCVPAVSPMSVFVS